MPFINGLATGEDLKLPLYTLEPSQLSDLVCVPYGRKLDFFLQNLVAEEFGTVAEGATLKDRFLEENGYSDNLPFHWKIGKQYDQISYLFQRYNPTGKPFADTYSTKLYEFYRQYIPFYLHELSSLICKEDGSSFNPHDKNYAKLNYEFGEREIQLPNNQKSIELSYYYAEYDELWYEQYSEENIVERFLRTNYAHIRNDCIVTPYTRSWLLRFESYPTTGQSFILPDNFLVASLIVNFTGGEWEQSDMEFVLNQIPEYYFYTYLDTFFQTVDDLLAETIPGVADLKLATNQEITVSSNLNISSLNKFNYEYVTVTPPPGTYPDQPYCQIQNRAEANNHYVFNKGSSSRSIANKTWVDIPDWVYDLGCLIYANNNNWNNYNFNLQDRGNHPLIFKLKGTSTQVNFSFLGLAKTYNVFTHQDSIVFTNNPNLPDGLPTKIDYIIESDDDFKAGDNSLNPYDFGSLDTNGNNSTAVANFLNALPDFSSYKLCPAFLNIETHYLGMFSFYNNIFYQMFVKRAEIPCCINLTGNLINLKREIVSNQYKISYKQVFINNTRIHQVIFDFELEQGSFSAAGDKNQTIGTNLYQSKAGESASSCQTYAYNSETDTYAYYDAVHGFLKPLSAFNNSGETSDILLAPIFKDFSPYVEVSNLIKSHTQNVSAPFTFNDTVTFSAENFFEFKTDFPDRYLLDIYESDLLEFIVNAHETCLMATCDLEDLKLWVKEIHQSLQAGKFAYLDNDPEAARVANLGYYIERIARVLGISVDSDGSIRSIRQAELIDTGDSIPAGWTFGQWSRNQGGSDKGQKGGLETEDRDGLVYAVRSNKFTNDDFTGESNAIEQGGYVLVENIPQLLHIMMDDLDRALGLQNAGANVLPSPDGQIVSYQGMNQMMLDLLYSLSLMSRNTSGTHVLSLKNQAILQEILGAFGLPVVAKELSVSLDGEKGDLVYPGLEKNSPTLNDLITIILVNLGTIIGSKIKFKSQL